MFFLRKIGHLLRGKTTPFQIIAGCLLGAWLGFMPGFGDAPGLTLALLFALLVLNANLFLAMVVGLLARLLAIGLMPVSFHVGRALLDGPTEGIFRKLINAPGLAWFGFESYVATGSLVVGGVVGLLIGWLIVRAVRGFRVKMAALDRSSPRYHEFAQKGWVRGITFLFAGGGLKNPDYEALLQQPKIGNPIRVLGVILVVFAVVLAVVTYQFFSAEIITAQLRHAMERANGATVDLERAELDLASGRMALEGVAAADPNALATDIFRAIRIEADVSGVSLLRKRLQLDRVVVAGATSGVTRRVPGRRTDSAAEPTKPIQWPDAGTIEDYLKNAQVWRERLAQVKQWLEKITGPANQPSDGNAPAEESLEQRLKRLAAEQGYANVKATHLVEGAPTFLVKELTAGGVTVAWLPGERLDITARNLSTQPSLAGGAPEISISSASDKLGFKANFAGLSVTRGDNLMAFHYRELPVDRIMGDLKLKGGTVLTGGTIDLAANGKYFTQGGTIELPLQATLKNTTLTLGGKQTSVSNFALPIGLTGSLSNPRIKVDTESLGDLAVRAGTAALKDKATERLQEKLGDKAGGLLDLLKKPEKK